MSKGKTVTCHGVHGDEIEVSVDDLTFRPSIYAVIIKDGKVLLSPNWDGYDFPGGGVDLGERIQDALAREVREETGLMVEMDKVVLVDNDFFMHPHTEGKFHSILMYCTCKNIRGEITTEHFTEHEKAYAGEAVWMPIEDALKVKFFNPVDSPALIKKVAKLS
jgi:ADP-ribose pyrophosphatase YjhB (NUDIX family)